MDATTVVAHQEILPPQMKVSFTVIPDIGSVYDGFLAKVATSSSNSSNVALVLCVRVSN